MFNPKNNHNRKNRYVRNILTGRTENPFPLSVVPSSNIAWSNP